MLNSVKVLHDPPEPAVPSFDVFHLSLPICNFRLFADNREIAFIRNLNHAKLSRTENIMHGKLFALFIPYEVRCSSHFYVSPAVISSFRQIYPSDTGSRSAVLRSAAGPFKSRLPLGVAPLRMCYAYVFTTAASRRGGLKPRRSRTIPTGALRHTGERRDTV